MLIAFALTSLLGVAAADETEMVIIEQDDAIVLVEVVQREHRPVRSIHASTRRSRRLTAERSWRVPAVSAARSVVGTPQEAHALASAHDDDIGAEASP